MKISNNGHRSDPEISSAEKAMGLRLEKLLPYGIGDGQLE
jgi:hypothetical protein